MHNICYLLWCIMCVYIELSPALLALLAYICRENICRENISSVRVVWGKIYVSCLAKVDEGRGVQNGTYLARPLPEWPGN